MRGEELYLRAIIGVADHIEEFIAGLDRARFQESELARSAVVQKLAIIGEAAARVSDEFRTRRPNVPWARIVAFRNILVHAYFGIDWDEVWRAARNESQVLRSQIEAILRAEFGGPALGK